MIYGAGEKLPALLIIIFRPRSIHRGPPCHRPPSWPLPGLL